MLAPMSMAQPAKAWRFAALTTAASVVGGLFGYLIGYFAFELIQPLVTDGGHYADAYAHAVAWFDKWGVWVVFVAGFSPIPYKVFTITAGALHMALPPFVLASVVGRGTRFFLVAALMAWGGEPMERQLRRYVDTIGWIMILLIGLVLLLR
jgi:membrane protein YqaA with SNARE-associated domain